MRFTQRWKMKGGITVLMAVAALAASADRADAQTIELAPNFGMHMPIGLLMEGTDPADNSLARRRQLGATSIGARLSVRTAGRLTFETSATYSPGLVAITDRTRTQDLGGRVLMANAKILYRIHGEMAGGAVSLHAGSGLGVVHRYGEGWSGTAGTTDGAVIIAGRGRLSRLNSDKAFIFTVEDYVTRAAFRGTNAEAAPRVHHDVVYSFGISIPLMR